VICSATQEGFRRRRSKDEMSALRVARSFTGPGNPYWKSPAGSTGEAIWDAAKGLAIGAGAGTDIVDVADTAVEEATAWAFFSDLVEYMAAVTAAPVVALTAAMTARVVLDMMKEDLSSKSCHQIRVCGVFIWVVVVVMVRAGDQDVQVWRVRLLMFLKCKSYAANERRLSSDFPWVEGEACRR
jgi:hypothetical protein